MNMKYLFAGFAGLLLLAGFATHMTAPDMQSDVPVIYWATDPNPVRPVQIEMFHEWLKANGHTTADGKPVCEMRIDSVSGDKQKLQIQGVAGVAADLMDRGVPDLDSYGMLADVTKDAKRLGFDMSKTYAGLHDYLSVDGRQLGFPCNVWVPLFWCNLDTFEKYKMPRPPESWTVEEFEKYSKEFVKRANPPGTDKRCFFTTSATHWSTALLITSLLRSKGASVFNETMTRCTMDDPRYAQVLDKIYQWTYVDRIMPTAADEASIATQAGGYGGGMMSLFKEGRYAALTIGRWSLIGIRKFEKPPKITVSRPPHFGYPNVLILTRAAGVYAGGKNIDKAVLFLAFLASDEYNQHIVDSVDALPPNPKFTTTEEYLRPKGHENEWGAHEVPAKAAMTIAIPQPMCPYVEFALVGSYAKRALERVLNRRGTSLEAGKEAADRVNREIAITTRESKVLRERYAKEVEDQKRIDKLKAAGKKIPLSLIRNPFYRRYYADKGMLEVGK